MEILNQTVHYNSFLPTCLPVQLAFPSHICEFNQVWIRNIWGGEDQKLPKAKLELAAHWQLFKEHLHCIYSSLLAFTLYYKRTSLVAQW